MRHGYIATISILALTLAWAPAAQAQSSDCYDGGGIDLLDLQRLLPCLTGPGSLVDECPCADLDGDGDSDLFDLGLFQLRFGAEDPCGSVGGGCLASHGAPGCSDAACCADVCAADPFCCHGVWDPRCVQTAMAECGVLSALDNDCCETPTVVTDGTTAFSNVGATEDGPRFACGGFPRPGLEIYADIWFTYTATCTGLAIVSLCGSEYDTTLAVYHGSACPTQGAIGCSDDDCWDLESRTIVPVVQGQTYLVRVGGYDEDETGLGVLSIRCTLDGSNDDVCRPGGGDCEMPHRAPGCADRERCEQVCDENPACCDVTWRDCAAEFLCCVYGSRGGGQTRRCTSETRCPRPRPGYSLRNSFPVSSCDQCVSRP